MGFLKNLLTTPKEKCLALCQNVPQFTITQSFWGENILYPQGVLIDTENRKIILASKKEEPEVFVYSYKDILKSEIIEAGNAISSTNRMSQVAGAAIGGILTGGVGVIVGGLSGSKKTVNTSTNLSVNVIVNDINRPLFQVDFLISEVKTSSSRYKDAMKKAQELHALISVLIKQADTEDNQEMAVNQTVTNSLADELKKISDLFQQGILTQDEYNKIKARIIAKA